MKFKQYIQALPFLMTPPIVSVLRNKWRDRGRSLPDIPDHYLYRPVYSPWLGNGAFGDLRDTISRFSLVSPDRLWVLYSLALNAAKLRGDFVECGVYKGGTAHLLARLAPRAVHLFDTYEGMPETDSSVDKHRKGDFADTALEVVKRNVEGDAQVFFHKGWIPESFEGADLQEISLLHIDLDIRSSILDTLAHCYEKVAEGGYIVFDDYGFESCYGARQAVDLFFAEKPEWPICLPTGQAIVIKLPGSRIRSVN